MLLRQATSGRALVCGTERVTYGELRDRVRAPLRCCAGAESAGERVAVKLPDGIAWVGAFLGTIWAGGIAVAVNPRIPADEWHAILGDAGFRCILAESRDDTPPQYRDRVVPLDEWLRDVAAAADRAGSDGRGSARVLDPLVRNHRSAQGGRARASIRARVERVSVERSASPPTIGCSRAPSSSSPIRRPTASSPG